jgi:multidrug efflux system membrane fusion protein
MDTSMGHAERGIQARRRAVRGTHAVALASILAAAALAGCARPAAQQGEPPPPKVTVAEVVAREITEWDEVTGRLEAVNTVEIRPRVSGFVAAVAFEEGAMVQRGQLLFQIDPRPFQAQVDRLAAELSRARATVQRTASERQRAERLGGQNAMSTEEQERRASAAEEAAAQVASVEAALRAAQLDLEFTRVTSPIAGRVGRAIVTEGNLVSSGPGEATLLTTVVSLDPMYAAFDADEQMMLRQHDGPARTQGRVHVQMALGSDRDFSRDGTLHFLDNRVDATTGTIRGRALFRNPDRQLTPGQFVRLRLVGRGGAAPGLLIQDRAVGTDLDKRFVFVVGEGDAVEYRAVTLGPIVDGLRVVRTGLAAGERIVVNGLQRVRPGVRVDAERVAMDGAATAAPTAAAPAGAAGH